MQTDQEKALGSEGQMISEGLRCMKEGDTLTNEAGQSVAGILCHAYGYPFDRQTPSLYILSPCYSRP